jgi:hypothetical protein
MKLCPTAKGELTMWIEASRNFQGLKLILVIIFRCHNVKTGSSGMVIDHVLFLYKLLTESQNTN